MPALSAENLSFEYKTGALNAPGIRNINLAINSGEFVAIVGKSGSGKSTLFHILGCLLYPDKGTLKIKDKDISLLTEKQLAEIRNENIGFVFQQFHLLPRANVFKNILLPASFSSRRVDVSRAKELAEVVGLTGKLENLPNQLSGGEQQRVAIARALLMDPEILLADEPTGNLDTVNAEKIFALLKELNAKGKTVVVITHDPELAKKFNRVIRLQDGRIIEDTKEESARSKGKPIQLEASKKQKPELIKLIIGTLPQAWENLKRNKARAILTMLGVVVGVASVFAMLTFGKYAKNKVIAGYQEMGANTVMIQGYPNWRKRATDSVTIPFDGFHYEKDLIPAMRVFPEIARISPLMMFWEQTVHFGGNVIDRDVQVIGVSENMLPITNRRVIKGRSFSPFHISGRNAVCMVGTEVVERLFKSVDPIDKILFMTDREGVARPCRVIGVMSHMTSNKDWRRPNLEIAIPFTHFQDTAKNNWDRYIHMMLVQFHPGVDTEKSAKALKAYFLQKYGKAAEIMIGSDAVLLEQMKKSLTLFSLLLGSIALVTLGVGGVGINNMMLVSVTERLKEIGLKKALGATHETIRTQFILEAVLLSVIAGFVGVLLGFVGYETVIYFAAKLVNKMQFEWIFEPLPFFLSLFSILAVGIASGIVPALKAEKLQVIEALRSE